MNVVEIAIRNHENECLMHVNVSNAFQNGNKVWQHHDIRFLVCILTMSYMDYFPCNETMKL